MNTRHVELDLLRTLAILLMVLFHLAFDLTEFYGWSIDLYDGAWWWVQRSAAHLFLGLVGASFAVSWNRTQRKNQAWTQTYRKYFIRGASIIGWGMVISLVTYALDPHTFIRFGVLHLIGTSVILLPLFARLGGWNFIVSLVFLTGWLAHDWGLPRVLLPVFPTAFDSLDYFPLFPWFGTVLIGYALGHAVYVQWRWQSGIRSNFLHRLTWPGRHSLSIYLLHQPLLIVSLAALHSIGGL